ncbi:alpha/beta hydrolase [Agarivorans sp. OAG1]|uniref:patatin-like phospholipase family protein n=1 Tax=Agarivorans sp. OAG1 TaxID=3082387 RepID=UPI002B323838|nr:alpha/beta hydrolase [Agarivorans sp. OAG1]
MKRLLLSTTLALVMTGCSSVPEHNAIAEDHAMQAKPIGVDNTRYWGNELNFSYEYLEQVINAQVKNQNEQNSLDILALSGGGANGAFGAGILAAWTETGVRPEFDMVTGISTGAILAIFAFLGEEYDDYVVDFYTNYSDGDLFQSKGLLAALRSMSMFNISPYEKMVRDTITPDLLSMVAEGHNNGRLLLVGTTHLESQRFSVWNMGAIAAQNNEESEQLFENIILASTAIPGAMPAVQIDVKHNHIDYQELHVDGGVARQVFFLPDTISASSLKNSALSKERNLYVIRNGEFLPQWKDLSPAVVEVSARSLNTIIKYQGRSDVMRIYDQATQADIDFNFAHIDTDFTAKKQSKKQFDQEHMRKLFDYGYNKMAQGALWEKRPPEFDTLTVDLVTRKP